MRALLNVLFWVGLDEGIYVMGGLGYNKQGRLRLTCRDIEVYHPASDSWTQKKPMPNGVSGTALAFDNKIFILGDGNEQIHVYDPQSEQWSRTTDRPHAYGSAAVALYENRLYLIGGHNQDFVQTNEVYVGVIEKTPDSLTFIPGESIGSSRTFCVQLGDIDQDGDLDVFAANYGQPNRVWFNDGQAHFNESGQLLGTAASHAVALGDLDGNGTLDAFVANVEDQSDRVWLNDGQGQFTRSLELSGLNAVHGLALVDLDQDEDLDLVLAQGSANTVWSNDGKGTFTTAHTPLGQALSSSVSSGDLNGDGTVDLIFANSHLTRPTEGAANEVWLNQ